MTDGAPGQRIASVEEVPEEGTFLFRVEPVDDGDVEREAVLVRTGDGASDRDSEDGGDADGRAADGGDADGRDDGGPTGRDRATSEGNGGTDQRDRGTDDGVAAWLNYCQHFTHIKLDKGGGAPVRNGEILCTNHGAMFETDTGLCTHGPCEGAYLNALDVRVEDGEVYLDDPEYAFVGLGPEERNVGDLSSTSNVEF